MPSPVTSSLTPPSATAVDAPMTSEGAPMLAPSPVATEVAEQRGSPNSTAERDSLSESLISMPSTMRYVLPYGASANGLTMAGERATELAQLRQRCAQQEATITRLRQERDALKRQVRNQPAPAAISLHQPCNRTGACCPTYTRPVQRSYSKRGSGKHASADKFSAQVSRDQ